MYNTKKRWSKIMLKHNINTFINSLPEKIQYLIGDAYCNTLGWRRFSGGKEFHKFNSKFKKTEFKSQDYLEKLQWEKFKKLLNHAYLKIPYYQNIYHKAGIKPSDIQQVSDLKYIPTIRKEDIVNHFDEFIDTGVNKNNLIIHQTGGSTGKPLKFYWDKTTAIAAQSSYARWKSMAGCRIIKDRYIYIGRHSFNNDIEYNSFKGEYYYSGNQLKFASTNMNEKILKKYIDNLRKFKPNYIQGYASAVYIIASYIYENQIEDIYLKAVLTSSDTLYPNFRKIIETAFHCKVFDRYGLGEQTVAAAECEMHNGMHIDMENCLVEVVDDDFNSVSNKLGEIVGTNLNNFAMPLIRYRTGDLAELNKRKCACGRQSYILEKLYGRKDDYITKSDGTKLSPGGINQVANNIESINEIQIVQTKVNEIKVKIVPRSNFNSSDKDLLIENFKNFVGHDFQITPEIVKTIPRLKNGKFKLIISEYENE